MKAKQNRTGPKAAVTEKDAELARKIAVLAPAEGGNSTAIEGLLLFRRTKTTACCRATYEPSVSVFAQGKKRVNLGGTVYLCEAGSFLLSSIDVPVESQIVEASETVPMLSMWLRLEMAIGRGVLSRGGGPHAGSL